MGQAAAHGLVASARLLAETGDGPNPYGIGALVAAIVVLVIFLIAMRRR